MEVKPIAWSPSRISDFKQCPKLLFHKAVAKDVPYEESPEMDEGKKVHKMFELRIASGTPFPAGYEKHETLASSIARAPGQAFTEIQMTLTRDLTPTGWFSKDAWVRIMCDILKINGPHAWAGDYKTGKIKFDDYQLEVTAAAVMTLWPEVQHVTTSFIWLRDGILSTETYSRDGLAALWDKVLVEPLRLQEYHTTNTWPAKPGRHCGWCPVNKLGKCAQAGAPARS